MGVATQDPELRKKFEGKPEHVVNFFFMLAEQIRGFLAKLGCRTFQEAIGRTEFLRQRTDLPSKASMLNYTSMLTPALSMRPGTNILGGSVSQDFELEKRMDIEVIDKCKEVIRSGHGQVELNLNITNDQRTFGATLSNAISLQFGDEGLPENTITLKLEGSAGQSFCAFLAKGVTVQLKGDANDYVGKCLSGGKVRNL